MNITWEVTGAIIGVVASIAAAFVKIFQIQKSRNKTAADKHQLMYDEHTKLTLENKQTIAVLESKLQQCTEDNKEEHAVIRTQIKDLTDLIHILLTKLAE